MAKTKQGIALDEGVCESATCVDALLRMCGCARASERETGWGACGVCEVTTGVPLGSGDRLKGSCCTS